MPLYRGSGGAIWEITPPDPGTHRREQFDAQLERGDLVLVEEPKTQAKPRRKTPEVNRDAGDAE
jgi:hypothetical protein